MDWNENTTDTDGGIWTIDAPPTPGGIPMFRHTLTRFQSAAHEIKFNEAEAAGERLNEIRLALDDCSSVLSAMSREAQSGLESAAAGLARWAQITRQRADEISLASVCIITAAESYREAEILTYNRLLEIGDTAVPEYTTDGSTVPVDGETHGNTEPIINRAGNDTEQSGQEPEHMVNRTGDTGYDSENRGTAGAPASNALFALWQNITSGRPDWANLPEPIQWLFIWPAIIALTQSTGRSPKDIFNFIIGLINKKTSGGESAAVSGNGGYDSDGGGGNGLSNVCTGTAVINCPETEFAAEETAVSAHMGPADSAAEDIRVLSASGDTGGQSPEYEQISGWAEYDGDHDGNTAANTGTYSGGASASAGGYGGNPSADTNGYDDGSFLDTGGYDGDASANSDSAGSPGAPVPPEYIPEHRAQFLPNIDGIAAAAKDPVSETGPSLAAAPVIGVAAAGAIGAAGAGLGRKHGNNSTDANAPEKPELPVVEAKQSGGLFTGELKGEYVLLGAAFRLLFTGVSVAAGVRENTSERNPDKFKTGYGVSAVFRDGVVQERTVV